MSNKQQNKGNIFRNFVTFRSEMTGAEGLYRYIFMRVIMSVFLCL